jgi:ribosomal protein S18 acetylase RimI-like enzyme
LIHVDVADHQATLNLLVVDPALRGHHVAERMTGVAQALCEAYGYEVAEPVVEPRRAIDARSRR